METTDDIKNFIFDIYINGKVLSSLKASYPQHSLSDDSSILLDTLFKIMEAIVEEITPAYNWPSGIRTPSLNKYWWQDQMESLVNVTTKNR